MRTIVTREPEWDDAERDKLEALEAYEAGVCSDCGVHQSLTDPSKHFYTFEDSVCPVCASVAQYSRVQADRDRIAEERLGDNPPPQIPRPGDGRRTYIRRMTDDEVEQIRNRQTATRHRG